MHTQHTAFSFIGAPHSLPPLPGWLTVVAATVGLVWLIRWLTRDSKGVNIIGELSELAGIAAAAAALKTTPLVSSAILLAQRLEAAVTQNPAFTVTVSAIALVLTVLAGILYIRTDNELATPLFAVLLLVLAAYFPKINLILQWIIDWPVSYFWRGLLTFVKSAAELRLTK